MKRNLTILSLFITISFFSCSDKNAIVPISDIKTDFPTSEKLDFKPFNKYDILEKGSLMIDDSSLWYFKFNEKEQNFGYCYDLYTGEKLSIIAAKGHAAYEFVGLGNPSDIKMTDDSIQLRSENSIKTFAKKDIISNKPMNERIFSVVTAPDSISVGKMIKLPNGSVVATLSITRGSTPLQEKSNINSNSLVTFNDNEVKAYETINYDSFDVKIPDSYFKPNDVIKNSYTYGFNEIKGNDMVVFSVRLQFILYTFDLNSGNIVNEKRYTEMRGDGKLMSLFTTNDNDMDIVYMKSNEKYIFCVVGGYFSEIDKVAKLRTSKIFVFDWNLNPVKCFDLPNDMMKQKNLVISNDCKSVYLYNCDDECLILTKADLNI